MKDFNEIYQDFHDPLYRFVLKLTAYDSGLAEEVTQECFYQAFLSLHRFRGKSSFFTWLCQIAKNCYFKYLRKNRELSVDMDILINELARDEAADIERVLIEKDEKKQLMDGILDLGKKQRDILILRVYFEQSYSEIGKLLGMDEGTVKVYYYRGKERLKDMFFSH